MKKLVWLLLLLLTFSLSTGATLACHCGDGIIHTPNDQGFYEECDAGAINGQPCEPLCDATCMYCSDTCELITVTGENCKGIDEECQDAGYDYGIAKWEWETSSWQPEEDPAGTLVTGNDMQATYSSGLDEGTVVAAAIVVKASTEREVIQGGSGTVFADEHALSHITFCGLDSFCGDGIKDSDEQCDGADGLIEGFYCTSNCELTPLTPVCPLSEADYDFIIDFSSTRIRSDSSVANSQTTIVPFSISQGDYQVTLVAHDAYVGRDNVFQPQEQYQLSFLDDQTQLALSSAHTDLTDYTTYAMLTETVDNALALPTGITGVRAVHPAYPDTSSPNSLNVVCAGLVDVTIHSFCGDGVVDEGEDCDAGDLNGEACVPSYSQSCEYCSATCELITTPGPYCGDDVVQEPYEMCDDGNTIFGDGCDATCQIEPLIIKAYKVVCEAEEHLPNWALSGIQPGEPSTITSTTAADFVAEHSEFCWLEDDWYFQWGYSSVPKLNGDVIGPAPVGTALHEWKHFDTPTMNGGDPAIITIYDLEDSSKIWVREVLKEGYIPFSNPPGNLQNPESAELLCGHDILNFDNYDWISPLHLGQTYHCITFNALAQPPSFCGDGVVDEGEDCDVGDLNGEACVPSYSQSCEYCSATCELITTPGPYCGDGTIQESYETCDAGNLNGVSCTPSYGGSCTYCSSLCEPITVPGPYCGDGIVNGDEACDGGAPEGYICTPQCTLEPIVDCLDISYIAPYFTNGTSQWIDTASRVALTYDDSLPVCVGANHYYKATPAPNKYCLTACSAWEPKSTYWTAYEQPFGLAQESCYVIEYYSAFDGVNSSLGWDCVFVDKTTPELNIHMADSVQEMSEINRQLGANFYPDLALDNSFCDTSSQHCVTVTMNTSVLLSCEDTATYASGVDTICFAVDFDGDDITSAYCDAYGGEVTAHGCCVASEPSVKLYFGEESWHKLTATCVDNVNKSSSTTRYLKVEGFDFEIKLNKKWNLISFPYRLVNDSLDAIFAGVEDTVVGVWTYHNGSWFGYEPGGVANNLAVAKPGWGYWVLALQEDVLRVRGSLFNSLLVPPQKEIFKGWNLVGYYGVSSADTGQNGLVGYYAPLFQGKTVGCALQSLAASIFHHPSSSILGYWELFNPDAWIEFDLEDRMDPGAGYWVFAYDDGLYVPSTICS